MGTKLGLIIILKQTVDPIATIRLTVTKEYIIIPLTSDYLITLSRSSALPTLRTQSVTLDGHGIVGHV